MMCVCVCFGGLSFFLVVWWRLRLECEQVMKALDFGIERLLVRILVQAKTISSL